jgi:glycosyltransferase involved in cell wall biosynthesis
MDTNNPLVSIIIPLYNAENYIAETLKSVLDQTWKNKEIIIVNDGSTDNSLAIVKSFDFGEITVISQKNKGASAAKQTGLEHAKGDYIQYLDADDLLSPNKIEAQVKLLIDKPGYLGLCGTVYFNNGDDPKKQSLMHDWTSKGSDDPVDFLIKLYGGPLAGPGYGGMIQPNAWLTPRSVIEKAGPWNTDISPCRDEDGEYFCRITLASSGIVYSMEATNYYRKFRNAGNLSGRKDYKALSNLIKSTDLKAESLFKQIDTPYIRKIFSRHHYENAAIFHPEYPNLVRESERKARELAPDYRYNPLWDKNDLVRFLSALIGWKRVRYLQHLKQSLKSRLRLS